MSKLFRPISKDFKPGTETEWFEKEIKRLNQMGLEARIRTTKRKKVGKWVMVEFLEVEA